MAIEQSRDREAISPLEGAYRRLRLRRKDAVDRARIKSKRLQMGFRHLDVAWRQDPVVRHPT
jgi:hypothetical protein